MERMFRSGLIVMLVFCVFPLSVCQGDDSPGKAQNIVLTPADQLILDAIDLTKGTKRLPEYQTKDALRAMQRLEGNYE